MAIRNDFDPKAIEFGNAFKNEQRKSSDAFSARNGIADQAASKDLDNPGPYKTRFAGSRAFRNTIFNDPEEAAAQKTWMDELVTGGSDVGNNWFRNYEMAMGNSSPSDNIDEGNSDTMSSEPTSADQEGTA